jgi:hypothetical protein
MHGTCYHDYHHTHRFAAVWRDANTNLFVILPCVHCHQFMIDVHPDYVHHTQVMLSHDVVVLLALLMLYHDWW